MGDCGDPQWQDRGSQEHWELMEQSRIALDWSVSEVRLWQQDDWDPRSQNPHGGGGRWLDQLQVQDQGSPQGVEELEPVLLEGRHSD